MSATPAPAGGVKPARAFAYLRSSTDRQTLETQKAVIRDYCKLHGLEVGDGDWFEEPDVSGTMPTLQRPVFSKMVQQLADLKEFNLPGPRNVVVYELSRVGRSMEDVMKTVWALEKTTPLMSASSKEWFLQMPDKALRDIILAILSWAAQLENDIRKQRIRDAVDRAKKVGRWRGQVPSGYKVLHSIRECRALGHDPPNCKLHNGQLVITEQGRRVYELLQENEDLSAKMVADILEIGYKKAWNMLQSVQAIGLKEETPNPTV